MMTLMTNIIAIIIGVVFVVCGVCGIYTFMNKPSGEQLANLLEALKYFVSLAEKELGSGVGQLKLRQVYNLVIENEKFSWVATYMSFEKFSAYVDDALEWMNDQIEKNPNFKKWIEGE